MVSKEATKEARRVANDLAKSGFNFSVDEIAQVIDNTKWFAGTRGKQISYEEAGNRTFRRYQAKGSSQQKWQTEGPLAKLREAEKMLKMPGTKAELKKMRDLRNLMMGRAQKAANLSTLMALNEFRVKLEELIARISANDENAIRTFYDYLILHASNLESSFKKDQQGGKLDEQQIAAISEAIYQGILPVLKSEQPSGIKSQAQWVQERARIEKPHKIPSVIIFKPRDREWFFVNQEIHLEGKIYNVKLSGREFKYRWIFSKSDSISDTYKQFEFSGKYQAITDKVRASDLGEGGYFLFLQLTPEFYSKPGIRVFISPERGALPREDVGRRDVEFRELQPRKVEAGAAIVSKTEPPKPEAPSTTPKFDIDVGVDYVDDKFKNPPFYKNKFMEREGWFFAGFYSNSSIADKGYQFKKAPEGLMQLQNEFEASLRESRKIKQAFNESIRKIHDSIKGQITARTSAIAVFIAGGVLSIAEAGSSDASASIFVGGNRFYTTMMLNVDNNWNSPQFQQVSLVNLVRQGTISVILTDLISLTLSIRGMNIYDIISNLAKKNLSAQGFAEALIAEAKKQGKRNLTCGAAMVIKITPKEEIKQGEGKVATPNPRIMEMLRESMERDEEMRGLIRSLRKEKKE